jgi:hypothetical protein
MDVIPVQMMGNPNTQEFEKNKIEVENKSKVSMIGQN